MSTPSANLNRPGYVDQAAEEGLIDAETDEVRRITIGQYVERLEVFGLVLQALREHAETLELAE